MDGARKRRISDAGEKIGGSRRDFAARRLEAREVPEMTDAEKAELVTRDAIWPKPDFSNLIASGMSAEAAALVKIIRERVLGKPALSKRFAFSKTVEFYATTLTTVRDHLEGCRSLADVSRAFEILDRAISRQATDYAYYKEEGFHRFDVIRRGRQNPVRVTSGDIDAARRLVADGFPADIPSWRRSHEVRKFRGSANYAIVRGGNIIVGDGFASEDAAWSWLEAEYGRRRTEASANAVRRQVPERPHLDRVERDGLPDRRNGGDISPQDFIDVFGFRGVEFGQWLPNDERQSVLNLGFDAMMDLAEVLGLEPGQMSLDGTLSVAFGARGRGGRAAAHYEPGKRVFNFTRLRGAGTLAHEFGHALDHYLGQGTEVNMTVASMTGWQDRGADARAVLAHRGPEFQSIGANLQDAINLRPLTKQERLDQLARMGTVARREMEAAARVLSAYQARERTNAMKMRSLERAVDEARTKVSLIVAAETAASAMPDHASFGMKASDFRLEAVKLDGPNGYRAEPTEMFARAFESYVIDALSDRGGVSDYLVAHATNASYPPDLYKGKPYPEGAERERIASAFADLMPLMANLLENRSTMAAPAHLDPDPAGRRR